MKTKFFISAIIAAMLTFTLTSCYTPSPLYGTWSDNSGNKIMFLEDGTFSAKVNTGTDSNGEAVGIQYSGEYTVLDNVIVITYESGNSRNTTWDLNGYILYLQWAEDSSLSLTLYHTAR